MISSVRTLFSDLYFSLANLDAIELLDLALVTVVFYALLNFLRRSRASVLLRGTLVLVAFFFVVTVFLPLPTFDFLLQIVLAAILIATPVLYQVELRHGLEELGRRVGTFNVRSMAGEATMKPLVRALENLSANCVGALIVLEGDDALDAIRDTGVPVHSDVTSELMQTIFYNGTPLHDGAVIIRGEKVLSAGCVLPVSNRQLYSRQKRLVTRHRAAVWLTETSDALVLVVSEETGEISAARYGRLDTDLKKTELREQIHSFYNPPDLEQEEYSLRGLLAELGESLRASRSGPESRKLVSRLGVLLISLLLALAMWAFVIQRDNPVQTERIEGIDLVEVGERPPATQLLQPLPEHVTAIVKTHDELLPSLSANSFQAEVSLAGLPPGLQRVDVDVVASVSPVEIVRVIPPVLDVRLVRVVTQTVAVELVTEDEEFLPPAFELQQGATLTPTEVSIVGPRPRVEEVASLVAELSVAEATRTIRRVVPVVPVDEDGRRVSGVSVIPERIEVVVGIGPRENAREAAVRVVTEGELPSGYRLRELVVEPRQVTLLGPEEALAEVGNFIPTEPVVLSTATNDLRMQMALEIPPGVDAVNSVGETVRSVLITIDVEAQRGNRVLSREIQVLGSPGLEVQVEPTSVDVLLSGPVPILDEIEAAPELLQITVEAADLTDLEPGETIVLTPTVTAPGDVAVQILPRTVRVTALE